MDGERDNLSSFLLGNKASFDFGSEYSPRSLVSAILHRTRMITGPTKEKDRTVKSLILKEMTRQERLSRIEIAVSCR